MNTLPPLPRFVWLGLACFLLAAIQPAQAAREPLKPEYLENDKVRIGVDLGAGGGIFYFSQKSPERNLLNHFDKGRFIQQSYYGVADGSDWNKKPWRWTPVQGGGWKDEPAKGLEYSNAGGKLYVKSRPKHWATGEDIDDAVMEEWIELRGNVAAIHFKFSYTGTVSHPATHQELPAFFADYDLPNLTLYTGSKPWTGAELTRKVPGPTNEGARADESWAAYLDDAGWGIGAYFPDKTHLTSYRVRGDGKAGPAGSACTYFAPIETMAITPGFVYEYDLFITIGDVAKMRETFQTIHEGRLKNSKPQP